MSIANNIVKIIKEGKAQLNVPKTVFYNPVQEFNRDLSILVIRTYLKHNVWHHKSEERFVKGRGGMKILDALSASGLRSIRYAKELGDEGKIVKSIIANDLSESAVDIIKKNIGDNGVQDIVTCSHSDANVVLHMSSRSYDDKYHIVDIDPFGSGAQFFDAAVKSIAEAGLLMVTCTDVAVLCGNSSESCFSRYGSMSLRGDFCHEQALRILLRSLESHAAVYGRYIKPLLSISADFYVRLFLQVFTQPAETKKSASKLSQLYVCKECESFELQPLGTFRLKDDLKQSESNNPAVKFKYKPPTVSVGDKCHICGGSYNLGGPIWSEEIHNKDFLELLKNELSKPEAEDQYGTFKRLQGIVYLASEELPQPLYYCPETIASKLQMPVPKSSLILSALLNAGFKVSATHANRTGFKTNAGNAILWDIISQIADDEFNHTPKNKLGQRILARPTRDKLKKYDLTHNPEMISESKKLSLLRFQTNPEWGWGPKSRPSAKMDDLDREAEADGDGPIAKKLKDTD